MSESVDRWLPDCLALGYEAEEAYTIARTCAAMQADGDERPAAEILAESIEAFDDANTELVTWTTFADEAG